MKKGRANLAALGAILCSWYSLMQLSNAADDVDFFGCCIFLEMQKINDEMFKSLIFNFFFGVITKKKLLILEFFDDLNILVWHAKTFPVRQPKSIHSAMEIA